MAQTEIRIATRKSPLALWQANYVKNALLAKHENVAVELVPMSTMGDKILDAPLAKVGGKGLFVKELEKAMLDNEADIAVHSMKDVPMNFQADLGSPLFASVKIPAMLLYQIILRACANFLKGQELELPVFDANVS